MFDIVGVRFNRNGCIRFFTSGGCDIAVGDRVLVDTDEGQLEACVVIAPGQILHSDLRSNQSVRSKMFPPSSLCAGIQLNHHTVMDP